MKQTLASLTAALYLSMFGCGEKEPECTKFENIAEVVYSQDNKDKSWSWNSDNGNTYMCYSSNPPCPDDSGSYVILGYGISLVQSSISVDPSTRTQRIIIVGNVYGSGTDIGLTVDDYDDSSEYDLKEDQYLSREELSEREDCSLNSIIFDLYKRPDYHNINTDGNESQGMRHSI